MEDPSYTKKDKYRYEQNAQWWCDGKSVGEIDLVVYHQDHGIVAICEMKSACFEIAIAARQHEPKLDTVSKNGAASTWAIGKLSTKLHRYWLADQFRSL